MACSRSDKHIWIDVEHVNIYENGEGSTGDTLVIRIFYSHLLFVHSTRKTFILKSFPRRLVQKLATILLGVLNLLVTMTVFTKIVKLQPLIDCAVSKWKKYHHIK